MFWEACSFLPLDVSIAGRCEKLRAGSGGRWPAAGCWRRWGAGRCRGVGSGNHPTPVLVPGGGIGGGGDRRLPERLRRSTPTRTRRIAGSGGPGWRVGDGVALHGAHRFDRPRHLRSDQLPWAAREGHADRLGDRLRAQHLDRRQRREHDNQHPGDDAADARHGDGERHHRRVGETCRRRRPGTRRSAWWRPRRRPTWAIWPTTSHSRCATSRCGDGA